MREPHEALSRQNLNANPGNETMRLGKTLALLAIVAPLARAAVAEEPVTVQSLLTQQFTVVGAVTPPGGGVSLFLQKQQQLFFCYVSETPQSVALTTHYCKPVQ
jgi:hypothetical protein